MFKFVFHDDIYTEKKAAGVTCFRINPGANFEKWVHQNSAEYTGDFLCGCLLDNFVMVTKRGYAAFYEHYVNGGVSDYYVEFQAAAAGCDPSDVVLYEFDGWSRTPEYREAAV